MGGVSSESNETDSTFENCQSSKEHKNLEFVENTPHPFWGKGINNNGMNMLRKIWAEEKDDLYHWVAAKKKGGKKIRMNLMAPYI